MKERNFTAAVKDREGDQPCFIVLEELQIGGDPIVLNMRRGTGPREAREIAALLNKHVLSVEPLKLRAS